MEGCEGLGDGELWVHQVSNSNMTIAAPRPACNHNCSPSSRPYLTQHPVQYAIAARYALSNVQHLSWKSAMQARSRRDTALALAMSSQATK